MSKGAPRGEARRVHKTNILEALENICRKSEWEKKKVSTKLISSLADSYTDYLSMQNFAILDELDLELKNLAYKKHDGVYIKREPLLKEIEAMRD